MPEDDLSQITNYLRMLASDETRFGPATALLEYGRSFRIAAVRPGWLICGKEKRCYNNSVAYSRARDDLIYAEGYALDPEIGFPIEHAWLIDSQGKVLDPTWDENDDHTYFGIAFKTSFVIEMLTLTGNVPGLLRQPEMRRHYGSRALFERGISRSPAQENDSLA